MISSLDQRKPNPACESLPRFDRTGWMRMAFGNGEKSAEMRRKLIETDLVDTALRDSTFTISEAMPQVLSAAKNNMVALPGQLFYSTQIPVCLCFLTENKVADAKRGSRDRREQMLFIDARKTRQVPNSSGPS